MINRRIAGNTDGIAYKTNGNDILIDLIIKQFEELSGIGMDTDDIDYYFAKDVNNYFLINYDENHELKIIKQKGVFNRKPYSTNYIVPLHVMEYFKAQIQGLEAPTMEDLWKRDPSAFMIRAKDTKLLCLANH